MKVYGNSGARNRKWANEVYTVSLTKFFRKQNEHTTFIRTGNHPQGKINRT